MKLEFDRPETPAEQKLREWAEAQAGGPTFARIHGALHGVIATSMEEADLDRSALRLLNIEAPEEIHALAVQAARELHALVPQEEIEAEAADVDVDKPLTVPRLTEHATFTEWLGGLGAVGLSDPRPFMAVLGARADLMREQQRKLRRKGPQRADGQALRETAQDVIFLIAMTPDEYLPKDFPAPARAKFAELRQEYLSSTEWEPAGREAAALDALTSVHATWSVQQVLLQLQSQQLLDGEVSWAEEDALQTSHRERKIRPNEPCPCGSGKKYKRCCGAPGARAFR